MRKALFVALVLAGVLTAAIAAPRGHIAMKAAFHNHVNSFWEVSTLKLVAEYMRDVILFEQMASRETDPERKEALEKQAKAFRKLADKRAKELGLAPLEPPPLL